MPRKPSTRNAQVYLCLCTDVVMLWLAKGNPVSYVYILVFHNKLFMEAENSKFQNPLTVTVRNENDTEDMLRALF